MDLIPRPLSFEGNVVGVQFDLNGATAVFSNRFGTDDVFARLFPETKFAFLKQVHGRRVLEAELSQHPPHQADGHWSNKAKLATGVFTADCIPLLLWEPSKNILSAIHAGWRGVAAGIIPHALDTLKNQGVRPENCYALLGPHIRQNSFEVGLDVAEQLAGYSPEAKKFVGWHKNPSKRHFDLTGLALLQLFERGLQTAHVWIAPENTFEDSNYASYRRDKGTGRRQLSFIFRG